MYLNKEYKRRKKKLAQQLNTLSNKEKKISLNGDRSLVDQTVRQVAVFACEVLFFSGTANLPVTQTSSTLQNHFSL